MTPKLQDESRPAHDWHLGVGHYQSQGSADAQDDLQRCTSIARLEHPKSCLGRGLGEITG